MYFLGCDGGATKYAYAICDEHGHVFSRLEVPGCDYQAAVDVFGRRMHEHVQTLTDQAGITSDQITCAVYGLSGYGEGETVEAEMHQAIAGALHMERFQIVNDSVIGWSGALGAKPGINVVSGTGSIAYGENENGVGARVGGWSLEFGDEGSSCWIAKQAINAFFRQADGRMERTMLYGFMRDRFALQEDLHLVAKLHPFAVDMSSCAGLQREIAELARHGDPCVQKIYKKAAKELGLLVKTLIGRLAFQSAPVTVSYSGGLFRAGEVILKPFEKAVQKAGGVCTPPLFGPLTGALGMAAKDALSTGDRIRMMKNAELE